MEFPSLDPNNNYIYIKFATLQSNALLMYTHDNQTGDKAEFLALEILEARLRFSFNLGSGTYKLMTMMKVSDGHFHTVIARRAGMVRRVQNPPPPLNGSSTERGRPELLRSVVGNIVPISASCNRNERLL